MSEERLQEVFEELGGEEAAKEALLELAADQADQEARTKICRVYAEALARTGKLLWIQGAMFGPDRAEGRSPFDFGSDDDVGLATVCQVGGELAGGTVDLRG
jgi:predicted NodU family carbamoyl transferase